MIFVEDDVVREWFNLHTIIDVTNREKNYYN